MRKRGFGSAIVVLSLVSLSLPCLGQGARRPALSPQKPFHARVNLTGDGSAALSVAFYESAGAGMGYDLLYADANFNGRFEPSEMVKARTQRNSRDTLRVASTFPPIRVSIPSTAGTVRGSNYCQLTFLYRKYTAVNRSAARVRATETAAEYFDLTASLTLRQGPSDWAYSFRDRVRINYPAAAEGGNVWGLKAAPALEINTRPDVNKNGHLGIALNVAAGPIRIELKRGNLPTKAHVEIKGAGGSFLYCADETLDKFAFG